MARPSDEAPITLPGFDVTCVVGRVEFMVLGEHETPLEAAMTLIGRHGAEGRYEFPLDDGRMVVTVERAER